MFCWTGIPPPPASWFGDFELILGCNLLFSYQPKIRRPILPKLCRALAPGGYFITGEAGRDLVNLPELRAVFPPVAIFQEAGRLFNHG